MKWHIIIFIVLHSMIHTYSQHDVIVSELCECINERTYFLQRLEKLIDIFQQSNTLLKFPLIKNHGDFSHPRIQNMLMKMEESRSCVPFFQEWETIIHYRNIDDQLFIREFTKVALLLVKTLYVTIQPTKQNPDSLNQYDFVFDNKQISYTESLTLRFYYAQRLRAAIEFLKTIRCRRESFFEFAKPEKECNCIFSSKVHFKHKEIIACIAKMEKTNTLEPIITLSHEFSSYKLIHNDQFTKEFVLLVLCVYKNLLVNNTAHRNPNFENIMSTYETIESLPLEQILATIDILTNELPMLLEHYHFYSYSSWKRWLKKYWWVPPIIGITIAVKIALTFKRRPLWYGNGSGHFRWSGHFRMGKNNVLLKK